MSAIADVLFKPERIESMPQAGSKSGGLGESNLWNPENFAREQIRSLVGQVFFAGGDRPVKQVVFSPADSHADMAHICDWVGRALALETSAEIAVVGRKPGTVEMARDHLRYRERGIKSWSTQLAANLWRVPGLGLGEFGEEHGTGRYWLSRLADLRNEFEYAIIHGPAAGVSSEAALLGQLADGIILVLDAQGTRRATVRNIKATLEAGHCRILGTVLSERVFPVPERIYRRL